MDLFLTRRSSVRGFMSGFRLFRIPRVGFGVICSDDLVAIRIVIFLWWWWCILSSVYFGTPKLDLWLPSPSDGCDQFKDRNPVQLMFRCLGGWHYALHSCICIIPILHSAASNSCLSICGVHSWLRSWLRDIFITFCSVRQSQMIYVRMLLSNYYPSQWSQDRRTKCSSYG
jgi:hypothetical protein